ncbi:hypothetical protein [Salinicola salarius]|uniref:hypothetical protein n=1 Tax=Salinicola salarius TaxID=430457 RepID=UPI000B3FFE6F|nr:hypothetical protein [Salinicola salarius]
MILFAMLCLLIQLWVSVRDRHHNDVFVGDPWDGRSLEWATSSPPPEYNFPVIPEVFSRDAFMAEKEQGKAYQVPDEFPDIEMPANSAMGVIIAVTGTAMAFGLTWYMWWLVILSAMVTLVAIIARGYVRKTTRTIPGDEVRRTHLAWIECVRRTTPVDRSKEQTRENRGLPVPPVEGAVQ